MSKFTDDLDRASERFLWHRIVAARERVLELGTTEAAAALDKVPPLLLRGSGEEALRLLLALAPEPETPRAPRVFVNVGHVAEQERRLFFQQPALGTQNFRCPHCREGTIISVDGQLLCSLCGTRIELPPREASDSPPCIGCGWRVEQFRVHDPETCLAQHQAKVWMPVRSPAERDVWRRSMTNACDSPAYAELVRQRLLRSGMV